MYPISSGHRHAAPLPPRPPPSLTHPEPAPASVRPPLLGAQHAATLRRASSSCSISCSPQHQLPRALLSCCQRCPSVPHGAAHSATAHTQRRRESENLYNEPSGDITYKKPPAGSLFRICLMLWVAAGAQADLAMWMARSTSLLL
jgi:hypothetical protein